MTEEYRLKKAHRNKQQVTGKENSKIQYRACIRLSPITIPSDSIQQN